MLSSVHALVGINLQNLVTRWDSSLILKPLERPHKWCRWPQLAAQQRSDQDDFPEGTFYDVAVTTKTPVNRLLTPVVPKRCSRGRRASCSAGWIGVLRLWNWVTAIYCQYTKKMKLWDKMFWILHFSRDFICMYGAIPGLCILHNTFR